MPGPQHTRSQTAQGLNPQNSLNNNTPKNKRKYKKKRMATGGGGAGPPPAPPLPIQAKYTAPIPKYDGNYCPARYLRKFESIMKTNNWTKDRWLALLAVNLEGTAEQFYTSWIEQQKRAAAAGGAAAIDFDTLAKALQQAFKSHSDKAMVEEKCRARRQLLNESPEAYTYALLALLQDFDNDMPEEEQVRWLTRNARPAFMKEINMHDPKTIDTFLTLMRRVQHTHYLMADRADIAAIEEFNNENRIATKLDVLTALVGQNREQKQAPVSDSWRDRPQPERRPQQERRQQRNQAFERQDQAQGKAYQPRNRRNFRTFPYCYICKGNHFASTCQYNVKEMYPQDGRKYLWCNNHGWCSHETPACQGTKNPSQGRGAFSRSDQNRYPNQRQNFQGQYNPQGGQRPMNYQGQNQG